MALPAGGKLVRDRIPELIRAAGSTPSVRRLPREDWAEALRLKLLEEVQELVIAQPAQVAEELADVAEVLFALAEAEGLAWDDVLALADRKREERGGFAEGLWLMETGDSGASG